MSIKNICCIGAGYVGGITCDLLIKAGYGVTVFDNLLFRYPTLFEFDESYKMISDNTPQILLGQSGQSKYDFADIVCD